MLEWNNCVPLVLSTPCKGHMGKMGVIQQRCAHKNSVCIVVIETKKYWNSQSYSNKQDQERRQRDATWGDSNNKDGGQW